MRRKEVAMDNRRAFLKKSVLASSVLAVPAVSSCACLDTIRARVPMKTRRVNRALVVWYSQTGTTGGYGRLMAKTMRGGRRGGHGRGPAGSGQEQNWRL